MIGMSQIKKKMMQGIIIGIGIGVVGIGLTIWWSISTIKSYEDGTNKKYLANFTKPVTMLTKDVVQGEVITEDMVTDVTRVHINTVPSGAFTSAGEVIGKVAKYSIAASVPLTETMLTTEIMASDIRSQEINTVLMPSDLQENDSVDIRIMFPNGTDYIVLAQKKVKRIEGETMWLQLGEDERLLLNAATVDSFLEQGTKLYATKYVDQDAQIKVNDDAAVKAQGYVSEQIKKQMTKIQTATETELTTILFGLIKDYKNFATTVTRTTENYQPNKQVMNLIKNNADIVEQAKNKLSDEARANIENSITDYESKNQEKYGGVVSGSQNAISSQKNQRDQLINGTI